MTASWWRRFAGPGLRRDSIRPIAQRWRSSASRTEIARRRIAVFQSAHRRRQLDLAEDEVDDAVDEVVLVGEVVVEGHRLDAELLAELAHAERLEPALIGELRARPAAPAPGSAGARRAGSVVRVVIGAPFGPDGSRLGG